MKCIIIGGSGYAGGELIRLLLKHPRAELMKVTSERYNGKTVGKVHPNLRKQTDLKFSGIDDLKENECDVLFVALPHGESMQRMKEFMKTSKKIIDLGADFRLNNAEDYKKWYGKKHCCPELLDKFVYGIPELHREEMKNADYISSAGCLATAAILGLYPLFKHNIIDASKIIVDAKVGSSASGNKPSLGSHHPERSHCVRSYKPTLHRHCAEIEQELAFNNAGKPNILFSPTAIEMVRGILATGHVFLKKDAEDMTDKDIWKIYRKEYQNEPFIRIVKEREGVYRYPEPKILVGTNFCDIGFEKDMKEGSNRVVVISAIDNLMKGAAGQAVQAFNIMNGFPETTGLDFPGLHPI